MNGHDPIYALYREYGKYRAGDVFVRKLGVTERADPGDLDYLTRRAVTPSETPIPHFTRRRLIAAVAAASGLSALGFGIVNSGNTGDSSRLARIPSAGSKIWSSPVPGIPCSIRLGLPSGFPPVVEENRLFVNSVYEGNHTYLYALRDSDGSQIWRMEGPGNGGFSAPIIFGDTLVLSTYNGELLAVRTSDGSELWSHGIDGGGYGFPVAGSGVVYISGSKLIAFRATDGTRLWSFPAASPQTGPSVVYAAGVVYVADRDGRVHALRANKGMEIWKSISLGDVTAQLAVDGILYVGGGNDLVHAFRASDGKSLWSFGVSGAQLTGIAVDAATVFVGTSINLTSPLASEGYLYALRASDGKLLWRFPAKGGVYNILATDRAVYLRTADREVCALQVASGSEIWRFSPESNVEANIVRAGNTIVLSAGIAYSSYRKDISVTTPNAGVYGLRASDGKKIWDFRTGTLPGPPTVVDSVAYVWCYDGSVYAIRVLSCMQNS